MAKSKIEDQKELLLQGFLIRQVVEERAVSFLELQSSNMVFNAVDEDNNLSKEELKKLIDSFVSNLN